MLQLLLPIAVPTPAPTVVAMAAGAGAGAMAATTGAVHLANVWVCAHPHLFARHHCVVTPIVTSSSSWLLLPSWAIPCGAGAVAATTAPAGVVRFTNVWVCARPRLFAHCYCHPCCHPLVLLIVAALVGHPMVFISNK